MQQMLSATHEVLTLRSTGPNSSNSSGVECAVLSSLRSLSATSRRRSMNVWSSSWRQAADAILDALPHHFFGPRLPVGVLAQSGLVRADSEPPGGQDVAPVIARRQLHLPQAVVPQVGPQYASGMQHAAQHVSNASSVNSRV